MVPYTIYDHKHEFAAWAAARAAGRGLSGFTNTAAKEIIEAIGLDRIITSPLNLPKHRDTDVQHDIWRQAAIHEAGVRGIVFTHGLAAKLINIYFKSAFVCAGDHDHPSVRNLHPPIDRDLLDALATADVGGLAVQWRLWHTHGWTAFGSPMYQAVIDAIRASIPGRPLWEIEEYWQI